MTGLWRSAFALWILAAGLISSSATAAPLSKDAQILKSQYLAKLALRSLQQNNQGEALALALEALPDFGSQNPAERTRAYWPGAEKVLGKVLRQYRPEKPLFAHPGGGVRAMLVTRDGKRIVTGSNDGTAKVWDVATGTLISTFDEHRKAVPPNVQRNIMADRKHFITSVAATPDGDKIITGSYDFTARVWDPNSGQQLAVLAGHSAPVIGVAVTADGAHAITVSQDKTGRLWRLDNAQLVAMLQGHAKSLLSVAVSATGAVAATAGWDKTIRLWNSTTGAPLGVLKGHQKAIVDLAFTADGKRLVSASLDKTARVWDVSARTPIFALKGHAGPLARIAISPDGGKIVTGGADRNGLVWDAATGAMITGLIGHSNAIRALAFSHDGGEIASAATDGTVRVWDAASGKPLRVFRGHQGTPDGEAIINQVALLPDGRVISGGDDGSVRIWDRSAKVRADNTSASNPASGDLYILAARAPMAVGGGRIITGARWVSARQAFANPVSAEVWNSKTGAKLNTLRGHKSAVKAVAATPDGQTFVTGSFDKTVRVWDGATATTRLEFPATDDVRAVAITADGQRVAFAGRSKIAVLRRLAPAAKSVLLKGHRTSIESLAFSPDGRRLITGSSDKTARIWDTQTGRPLAVLRGHKDKITAVLWAVDGKTVFTGSQDHTARQWNTQTGQQIAVFEGHQSFVQSLALTPGRARSPARLVTGGFDRTVRVWDIASGAELAKFEKSGGSFDGLAVGQGVKPSLSGPISALVQVWSIDASTEALVRRGIQLAISCLTPARRAGLLLDTEPPAWCFEAKIPPFDKQIGSPECQRIKSDLAALKPPPGITVKMPDSLKMLARMCNTPQRR